MTPKSGVLSNGSASALVRLLIGHTSRLLKKPTEDGRTHEWAVFVRPTGPPFEDRSFIKKVIFHLHESFEVPERVIKNPPFEVVERGYGSFTLPIHIYFSCETKPYKISYELSLSLDDFSESIFEQKLELKNIPKEFVELVSKYCPKRTTKVVGQEHEDVKGAAGSKTNETNSSKTANAKKGEKTKADKKEAKEKKIKHNKTSSGAYQASSSKVFQENNDPARKEEKADDKKTTLKKAKNEDLFDALSKNSKTAESIITDTKKASDIKPSAIEQIAVAIQPHSKSKRKSSSEGEPKSKKQKVKFSEDDASTSFHGTETCERPSMIVIDEKKAKNKIEKVKKSSFIPNKNEAMKASLLEASLDKPSNTTSPSLTSQKSSKSDADKNGHKSTEQKSKKEKKHKKEKKEKLDHIQDGDKINGHKEKSKKNKNKEKDLKNPLELQLNDLQVHKIVSPPSLDVMSRTFTQLEAASSQNLLAISEQLISQQGASTSSSQSHQNGVHPGEIDIDEFFNQSETDDKESTERELVTDVLEISRLQRIQALLNTVNMSSNEALIYKCGEILIENDPQAVLVDTASPPRLNFKLEELRPHTLGLLEDVLSHFLINGGATS